MNHEMLLLAVLMANLFVVTVSMIWAVHSWMMSYPTLRLSLLAAGAGTLTVALIYSDLGHPSVSLIGYITYAIGTGVACNQLFSALRISMLTRKLRTVARRPQA